MKIAVLAWGSLLWSPRELAVSDESWNEDGPLLPIEFSRIASDGRLTLVIDKDFDDVQVYWKLMKTESLVDAIDNLKCRECADSIDEIGFVDLTSDRFNIREDINFLIERVQIWAKDKGLDAVVWTDLLPKFYEKTKKQFTLQNAIDYLDHLKGEEFIRAKEYIEKAPPLTQTRFRRSLEKALNEKSR